MSNRELSDLEITKRCAEAMELISDGVDSSGSPSSIKVRPNCKNYDPLHDDAQAMALVKEFEIDLIYGRGTWLATVGKKTGKSADGQADLPDLNRAICECVAKMVSK